MRRRISSSERRDSRVEKTTVWVPFVQSVEYLYLKEDEEIY